MAGKRTGGSEAGNIEPISSVNSATDGDGSETIYHSEPDRFDDIPSVEPTAAAAEQQPDTTGKRGRGRPRGSKTGTGTSNKAAKETANDLSGILLSLHMMGAAFLKVEELELDEAEAARLGKAVQKVNELYGGFILTEKQQAWANLSMAAAAIYGPRFMAYKLRMKAEAAKQPVVIDAPMGSGFTAQPQRPVM